MQRGKNELRPDRCDGSDLLVVEDTHDKDGGRHAITVCQYRQCVAVIGSKSLQFCQ